MQEGRKYRLTKEFWQVGNGRRFDPGTVFTYEGSTAYLDWFAHYIKVDGQTFMVYYGLPNYCEEVSS